MKKSPFALHLKIWDIKESSVVIFLPCSWRGKRYSIKRAGVHFHTSPSYLRFAERRFRVSGGGLWLKIDGWDFRPTLAAHDGHFVKQHVPLKCWFPLFAVAPTYFLWDGERTQSSKSDRFSANAFDKRHIVLLRRKTCNFYTKKCCFWPALV